MVLETLVAPEGLVDLGVLEVLLAPGRLEGPAVQRVPVVLAAPADLAARVGSYRCRALPRRPVAGSTKTACIGEDGVKAVMPATNIPV